VSLALVCGFLIERFIALQSVLLVFFDGNPRFRHRLGLVAVAVLPASLSVLAFNFFPVGRRVYTFAIA